MKKVMKKTKKITVVVILVLCLGIIFVGPAFSGTSISGAATCRVPYLITLADGRKVASESESASQESLVSQPKENDEAAITENSPNLIQQEEEIVSEDSSETKQTITVCAK